MKNKIRHFIESTLASAPFDGCECLQLDNTYCLVFVCDKNDDNHISGKIAYNCDDLQCDYDYDWYMPMDENDDVIDTERYPCELFTVDSLTDYFTSIYEQVCKK